MLDSINSGLDAGPMQVFGLARSHDLVRGVRNLSELSWGNFDRCASLAEQKTQRYLVFKPIFVGHLVFYTVRQPVRKTAVPPCQNRKLDVTLSWGRDSLAAFMR